MHNHEPELNVTPIWAEIKRMIEANPMITTGRVMTEIRLKFARLPSNHRMRNKIKEEKQNFWPKAPANAHAIDIDAIDGKFKEKAEAWKEFQLIDKVWTDEDGKDQRILAFGQKSQLKTLGRARFWCADGTFNCVHQFQQLYIIHASTSLRDAELKRETVKNFNDFYYNNKVVPIVYSFMTCKTEEAYTYLYEELKKKIQECGTEFEDFEGPPILIQDFEKSPRNAITETFRNTKVTYCFFHFAQSLMRRIQTHNGAAYTIIKSQPTTHDGRALRARVVRTWKNVQSLALVNPESIDGFFNYIKTTAPAELKDFMEYFENNYIGRLRNGIRQVPRYVRIKLFL